jgi:hypothetical protein
LVDNNLGCLIQIEPRHWPGGPEGLPDVHFVFAKFLMVLVDGDLRIGRAIRWLEI